MFRFFLKKYTEKPRNHRNTGVHLALVFFPKNWQGCFQQIACLLRELRYAFFAEPQQVSQYLPEIPVPIPGVIALMTSQAVCKLPTPKSPYIQCPQCEQMLPLRITGRSEQVAATWKCATCNVPVVGFCEKALLQRNSHTVLFDDRYFDVSDVPEIDLEQRQAVAQMAQRKATDDQAGRRQSQRVALSLVAPAVCLTPDLMPFEAPFQVMVANLSREGIGLVNRGRIKSDFIAMLLTPQPEKTIQSIVRIVRHLRLEDPYYEVGGEFHLRLGGEG